MLINYHLGLTYYQQGAYKDAQQIFENTLELSEDFEYADNVRLVRKAETPGLVVWVRLLRLLAHEVD